MKAKSKNLVKGRSVVGVNLTGSIGAAASILLQKWCITRLKVNVGQGTFYGDMPEVELNALVADIDKNGLRQPIEILPDGTIIDGHQRRRAAEVLGWTHIDVIVRYDLADKTDADRELAFLKSNHLRRHQHPLDRARIAKRLIELRRQRLTGELDKREEQELRDQIGQLMGCSPRNASRYMHLLNAPLRVQQLVRDGLLHLNRGAQVGLLSQRDREGIDQRLSGLDDPRRANTLVAAALLSIVGGKPEKPAIKPFIIAIEQANKVAAGRAAELASTVAARHLDALVTVRTVVEPLITKATEARGKKDAAMAKLDSMRQCKV